VRYHLLGYRNEDLALDETLEDAEDGIEGAVGEEGLARLGYERPQQPHQGLHIRWREQERNACCWAVLMRSLWSFWWRLWFWLWVVADVVDTGRVGGNTST
jgi:hypothetical protein